MTNQKKYTRVVQAEAESEKTSRTKRTAPVQPRVAILVMGMHRSGTSATTGYLAHCGISVGNNLMSANAENKKGYYENLPLNAFNIKILAKHQFTWSDLMTNVPHTDNDVDELIQIIEAEFAGVTLFAIKDPRIIYLFPLYKAALTKLKIEINVIVPYRNPFEVAHSLNARAHGPSIYAGLFLWAYNFLLAEKYTRGIKRLVIKYDDLLRNPKTLHDIVLEKFGIQLSPQSADESFLEKSLKHQNIKFNPELYPELQLVEIVKYVNKFDTTAQLKVYDAIFANFMHNVDLISKLGMDHVAYLQEKVAQLGGVCYIEVYCDTGEGFNARDVVRQRYYSTQTNYSFNLDLGGLKRLRLDPIDCPGKVQLEFAKVVLDDGTEYELKIEHANANDVVDGHFIFYHDDANLVFEALDLEDKIAKQVVVSLRTENMPTRDIAHFFNAHLRGAATQISQLEQNAVQLNQELQHTTAWLANKDTVIAAKDAEIVAKDQAIDAVKSELAAKDTVIASKDAEIVAKDQAIAAVQSELTAKDELITSKDQVIASKVAEMVAKDQVITAVQSELSRQDTVIAAKESELLSKNQLIEAVKSELSGKDTVIASRDSELSGKNQVIEAVQSELADKGEIVAAKNRELLAKEQSINQIRQNLDELNTKFSTKSEELENLQLDHKIAVKAHQSDMSKLSSLLGKNHALTRELQSVQEQYARSSAETAELSNQLQFVKDELSNEKNRYAESSALVIDLSSQLQNVQHELHIERHKPVQNFRGCKYFPVFRSDKKQIRYLFDKNWYIAQYGTKANPEKYFLNQGWKDGEMPHPLFDTGFYIAANGLDCIEQCPLLHFLAGGGRYGYSPHPLFDASWYLEQNSDLISSGMNPLIHYLTIGANEGLRPNKFFDSKWYLEQNPDVKDAGINPLVHYVLHGATEGRNPSLDFDAVLYLEQHLDLKESGMLALEHYILHGKQENREIYSAAS